MELGKGLVALQSGLVRTATKPLLPLNQALLAMLISVCPDSFVKYPDRTKKYRGVQPVCNSPFLILQARETAVRHGFFLCSAAVLQVADVPQHCPMQKNRFSGGVSSSVHLLFPNALCSVWKRRRCAWPYACRALSGRIQQPVEVHTPLNYSKVCHKREKISNFAA